MTNLNIWKRGAILAGGILAVSTSAIWVRLAFTAVEFQEAGFSLVLAVARLGMASLVLLPTWVRHPKRLAQGWRYGLLSGLCLAIHFAAWISSLAYTSIVASTVLVTTNPLWVALLSWWWLGERPRPGMAIGIGVAVLGSGVIGLGGGGEAGQNPLLGNGLALVGAWTVSVYLLLGQEAQRRGIKLERYVTIVYSTAALLLLPISLLLGGRYLGYPLPVYGCMLGMALFPQLIGHTAINWSLHWLSPTWISLAILFEPIAASLMAYVLFREVPTVWGFLGAGITLLGVVMVILGRPKSILPPPSPTSSTGD